MSSARHKLPSQRDDRFIVRNILRNRHSTVGEVRHRLEHMRNVNVSLRTVNRRLSEAGLIARRPAKE